MRRSPVSIHITTLAAALAACGGTVATGSTGAGGGAASTSATATAGSGGAASTSTGSTSSTASTSTGPQPAVCVVGQDQTCNDDPVISSITGTCQPDGTCVCNPGFEVNPQTGHCRPATDAGAPTCGDQPCKPNEFCVERVHAQDAGAVPSTWQCQIYFQCMEHTCACALQNFVSASCIDPTCVSESPVELRCDDLN